MGVSLKEFGQINASALKLTWMFTKYIPENFEFEMFVEHLNIGTKGEAEGILINESVIEAMDDVADEDVSNSDDGDDDDMGDDDKLFVLEYYLVLPF